MHLVTGAFKQISRNAVKQNRLLSSFVVIIYCVILNYMYVLCGHIFGSVSHIFIMLTDNNSVP